MPLTIIILAAGAGKRMHSSLPKVLHRLAGETLLERVIKTAQQLSPNNIFVVYGHREEKLREYLQIFSVHSVLQQDQLGTGHATAQVLPHLNRDDRVLILYGDVPLISAKTLQALMDSTKPHEIGLLTTKLSDPSGYGRVIRDEQHRIHRIVEQRDATDIELRINEINTGILLIPAALLHEWLPNLNKHNAQGEYYLTDVIKLASEKGIAVHGVTAPNAEEILGVNDHLQLATLERYFQYQQAQQLLLQGVGIRDPNRFDLRGELVAGKDVHIDINVILEGRVVLGEGVSIGAFTVLRNVAIDAYTEIRSHSVIEDTTIGKHCVVGPFARIRPETELMDHVRIGNFVEVKKSHIGTGSKVPHLSYVGDAIVGCDVNVGAGTITCNYDGANKHKTIIGDRVFIGSDTQLIAPIEIGSGATIAAGSTVRKNVPPEQLTITHDVMQRTIDGWKRPKKEEK